MLSLCQATLSAPVDEVSEALTHAEALYYDADFTKSIELLQPADELLRTQPDRLPEKISVKLQLALAYIGLNDNTHAKAHFRALYALDADHSLDTQRFSPKVIRLAEEAKAEQIEIECTIVWTDTQRQLGMGNAEAAMDSIERSRQKCPVLDSLAPDTAELLFKDALEAYRRSQPADALPKFRSALKLDPDHELAANYIELAESKLQVEADSRLLAWRKHFDAGAFILAAADYRQLVSFKDSLSAGNVDQAQAEYRKALTVLVQSSNRACANGDAATVSAIRRQISQMLPDPSLGDGILEGLSSCTSRDCVQTGSQLVLTRLKKRVDPEIPATLQSLLRQTPVTVNVQMRINEQGNVVVTEVQGNSALNASVRSAVERWKFSPTVDANGPRCVDTEIPIVLSISTSNGRP